jgi:hypothetical protein
MMYDMISYMICMPYVTVAPYIYTIIMHQLNFGGGTEF